MDTPVDERVTEIKKRWKEWVGEPIFHQTTIQSIEQKVLIVLVKNSGWISELERIKRVVVQKLMIILAANKYSVFNSCSMNPTHKIDPAKSASSERSPLVGLHARRAIARSSFLSNNLVRLNGCPDRDDQFEKYRP